MSEKELTELKRLLTKLRQARLEDDASIDGYTVEELEEMELDELYEIDDGDNLIQGIDIVLGAID